MTTFAYGDTVTIVSRALTGQDEFGNDVYSETSVDVPRVPVWPRASSENVQGEDQVIIGLAALLPAGTDVAAIDAVIVAGARYEIDGEPARFRSPFTNLNPGVQVNLTRVTG